MLRPSAFLPCIVGTANRLFFEVAFRSSWIAAGSLWRPARPSYAPLHFILLRLPTSAFPPLHILIFFFLLYATIHPSSPSPSLSLLLYLSTPPHTFSSASPLRLTSFHLLLLFPSRIYRAVKSLLNLSSTLYCQKQIGIS